MTFSDESYNLRIELDTKDCDLSPGEIEKMEADLDSLRNVVASFPVSNLYITVVHHPRPGDFHVKTSLALSGKTLFTGDRAPEAHPAFERCVRKLVKKVKDYKQQMDGDDERAKQAMGTHQTITPANQLDIHEINDAIEQDDYVRFRRSLGAFEEPLRKRIGRWLQRFPEIEAQLDRGMEISDIVEEVYLNAFESFSARSNDVPPGDWLESLIDPSVQAILQSPDEEFANISFARSMLEMES